MLHLCCCVVVISVGTESAEVEEERQRNAQASWTQRMFTSMVGDTSLFNTREGRAGKVHNFMLGLQLNTGETDTRAPHLMSQVSVEDEVDAVTGETGTVVCDQHCDLINTRETNFTHNAM